MPVIAVVNRKGGSGKTTLATHLAVYCAGTGLPVMLADVDRQRSTAAWLRRRAAQKLPRHAAIKDRTFEPNTVVRPAAGFAHMILDTPGGLRGFDLMRVVMYADAVLIPVGNSVFDRESTADCFAELKALPRIATGRCKVAAVGMRLDARTNADQVLRDWAAALQLPYIGALRATQAYVRCVERGLTLFDLPAARVETDIRQWQPVIDWLEPILEAESGAMTLGRPTSPLTLPRKSAGWDVTRVRVTESGPDDLPRTQSSRGNSALAVATPTARATIATRIGRLMDALPVPRFLQRTP